MTKQGWLMGVAAAGILAGGALLLKGRSGAGPVQPPPAPKLEADRASAARLVEMKGKEDRLAAELAAVEKQQAALDEREKTLEAEEKARAALAAVPVPSGNEPPSEAQMSLALANVDLFYGDLLDAMGLTGERRKAVAGALAWRFVAQEAHMADLCDASLTGEEIFRRHEEALNRAEDRIAQALSGEERARLEAYDRELPAKQAREMKEEDLKRLRLPKDLRGQVLDAVMSEQKPGSTPYWLHRPSVEEIESSECMINGKHRKGKLVDQKQAQFEREEAEYAREEAARNERIYAKVRPLLTPDKFEAFRRSQERTFFSGASQSEAESVIPEQP